MDDHSGWQPDPTGRHQERYYNANGTPTNLVRNDGLESTDEDRVASARKDHADVAGLGAPPTSSVVVSGDVAVPTSHPDDTGRVLVTRYTAATDDEPTQGAPTGQFTAITGRHAHVDPAGRRSRWRVVAVCLLLGLLVAASVFAIQQHSEANKWKKEYHAELSDYHSENHKSAELFVQLLASHQQVTTLTNQKNAVCLVLESLTRQPGSLAAAACGG